MRSARVLIHLCIAGMLFSPFQSVAASSPTSVAAPTLQQRVDTAHVRSDKTPVQTVIRPEVSSTLVAATGGSLTGTVDVPSSNPVNLTTEGTADWIVWGNEGTTERIDRKITGNNQISSWSLINTTDVQANPERTDYSTTWSDGTPQLQGSYTGNIETLELHSGFKITAPADTTWRVLRVYVGLWHGRGKFLAHLSDGSAVDYVDTSLNEPTGMGPDLIHVYTLTYHALSANQSLEVSWTLEDSYANEYAEADVSLSAATLQVGEPSGPVAPQPDDGTTLMLNPPTAGPNVVGTTQAFTSTLQTRDGAPIANTSVQLQVTGATTTTLTATTNSAGVASFSYTGLANGTDTVQASATVGQREVTSAVVSVGWVRPAEAISTSTVWGRFFATKRWDYFIAKPTDTPVLTMTFPTINFNPPRGSTIIPGNTSGVDEWTKPFTSVTTDIHGQYTGVIPAASPTYQAGVLDPTSMTFFNAVFTSNFVVAAAGTLTLRFWSDDAFILGVGPSAQGQQPTRVKGEYLKLPASGVTAFEQFPLMGGRNTDQAPAAFEVTIFFPAPGTYPYELDYAQVNFDRMTLVMSIQDPQTGTITGLPPSGALALGPATVTAKPTGQTQTLSVKATDASGLDLPNLPVAVQILGANPQTLNATTNVSGTATVSYRGANVGTDTAQATGWISGIPVYSGQVSVPWTKGTAPSPADPYTVPGVISSPRSQSVISDTVPIVLAAGTTLQQGTISYWPADNPDAVTVLATNVQASGGATLAVLDTTVLANGSYVIAVDGQTSAGVPVHSAVMDTVTGDYKPGRVRFSVTDLTVPLTGMPITIGRTYDSLERQREGDFGYGWSLSIGNPRLTVDPAHNVTLTQPNGQRVTFSFHPESYGGFLGFLLKPAYLPEAGVYGSLTADGCSILAGSGNGYICFLDKPDYQPTTYTYTDPYGRVFTMASDGTLRKIQDLNGNVLAFTSSGITSSAGGAHVTFTRDSQGRISQITDPAGQIYTYGYDSNGDLTTTHQPGVTAPTSYTYTAHYIQNIVDARGNTSAQATYYADGRLQSETDAVGNTTQYAYDVPGHKTSITNPDGGVVTSVSDSYGKVLSETDALNHTTSYAYNAAHKMTQRVDPLNHVTTYAYDAQGNQTRITNALNQTQTTTYNKYSEPTTKTNALNQVETFQYDKHFNPTGIADAEGQKASFRIDEHGSLLSMGLGTNASAVYAYDTYGNTIRETNPLSATTVSTYDMLGRLLTRTDAQQQTTSYGYDAANHVRVITDALGFATQYEYDSNGNQTAAIDARGNRTSYVYDAANRQIEVHYPDATVTHTTYNFRNQPLTQTDQAGHGTTFVYDLAGQLQQTITAAGTPQVGVERSQYDAAGRKIAQTDALSNTTTYGYDEVNRLIQVTNPDNKTTTYHYNAAGQRDWVRDAKQQQTSYIYDARGRLRETQYPDGSVSRKTYDSANTPAADINQAGQQTTYVYDDNQQLLAVTNALSQTTQYTYNPLGQLHTITDANQHTTTFAYTALGQLAQKTWADGQHYETFAYDAVGNLKTHRLADGHTNTFDYDAMNRLQTAHYFDTSTTAYTYTKTGQQETVTDARGVTRYVYDARNRLQSVTTPANQSLTYVYDAAGNRTSLTTPDGTIGYTYAFDHRLRSVVDPQIGTTTYTYDDVGLRSSRTLPNGVSTTYTYDALNHLKAVTQQKANVLLASYTYDLDAAGKRMSVTLADGSSVHWGYDAGDRLTAEVWKDAQGNATLQSTYGYDQVGNRLSQTINGQQINYSYNALDEMTMAGGVTYHYDDRGNLISDGVTTYTWDAQDRMVSAATAQGNVAYSYDADGRRVQQIVGGATINYLWDEASEYGDVVRESDTSGSTTARYVLGGTELLAQRRAGVTAYYLQDGQGSIRTLTDVSGATTDRYDYTAFGELHATNGSTLNSYRYTGQQFDAATGLYSLRARYYGPGLGRFLSQDTASVDFQNPQGLMRYGYVAENPTNAFDPMGLFGLTEYTLEHSETTEESGGIRVAGTGVQDVLATEVADANAIEARLIYNNEFLNPAAKLPSRYRDITLVRTQVIVEGEKTEILAVSDFRTTEYMEKTRPILEKVAEKYGMKLEGGNVGTTHAEKYAVDMAQKLGIKQGDSLPLGISNFNGPCSTCQQGVLVQNGIRVVSRYLDKIGGTIIPFP